MVLSKVDHAKTCDKICVLAPAPFDDTSVHTVVLEIILMKPKPKANTWGPLEEQDEL